jgi:hypothetical protein
MTDEKYKSIHQTVSGSGLIRQRRHGAERHAITNTNAGAIANSHTDSRSLAPR